MKMRLERRGFNSVTGELSSCQSELRLDQLQSWPWRTEGRKGTEEWPTKCGGQIKAD